MKNSFGKYRFGVSLLGILAFAVQELPYLPLLLWPPQNNPLAGNQPANPLLGILEMAGGILTVALLILIVRKDDNSKSFGSPFFIAAVVCLAIYYVSWVFYFSGTTNGWLIVIGLTAVVPLYYFFVALWRGNLFAVVTSIFFAVGHISSNTVNYVLH